MIIVPREVRTLVAVSLSMHLTLRSLSTVSCNSHTHPGKEEGGGEIGRQLSSEVKPKLPHQRVLRITGMPYSTVKKTVSGMG